MGVITKKKRKKKEKSLSIGVLIIYHNLFGRKFEIHQCGHNSTYKLQYQAQSYSLKARK